MAVRELSDNEKVDVILNQIIDNFHTTLNGQTERLEDGWGYDGTWIIQEGLNYPDCWPLIDKLSDYTPHVHPDLQIVLTTAADIIGMKYYSSIENDGEDNLTFNDKNEIEALTGLKIDNLCALKFDAGSVSISKLNDFEHFIDQQTDCLIDEEITKLINEEHDILIVYKEDECLHLDCYEPIYDIYRKYGENHGANIQKTGKMQISE